MIHRFLKIGRWKVDFLFAEDKYDEEEVYGYLYTMDASDDILSEVGRIMESGYKNTGFTYVVQKTCEALIVTGPASSGKQFLNTISHEARHLADAIAKSLGVELDSEPPAYVTGDTVMALADTICRLGCGCYTDK